MARPRFKPTEEDRLRVQVAAGFGMKHEDICLLVFNHKKKPIDDKTLRKHFRHELNTGMASVAAQVCVTLLQRSKRDASPAAAIFLAKALPGLKLSERVRLEHTGKDGRPIAHVDLTNASDEDLEKLEAIYAKLGILPESDA